MNIAAKCKFCHKPLTLEIDDDYAQLGDKFKLIPLAACNWCADIRVERQRLEKRIETAAVSLARMPAAKRGEMRESLCTLTRKYAEFIARWHHRSGGAWDVACVDLLIDKPEYWGQIVGKLWTLYRDWARQQNQTQEAA